MTVIDASSEPVATVHSPWAILGTIAAAAWSQRDPLTEAVAVERYVVPGSDLPIIPGESEMRGLAAMAVTLAAANAVPAALRDKPNDVFLVLLTGRDLGMSLTTAMRELHVIEGKVTLSPKVRLALVRERGRREGWRVWPDPENSEDVASWNATRTDTPGQTFRSTFSWTHAQMAGLADDRCEPLEHFKPKCQCKTNWMRYPTRMLSHRALGYLMDDSFPEVAVGIYQPDEMGAMTDDEGNPVIDVASTEPLSGTKAPRGHNRKAKVDEVKSAPVEELKALEARIVALPDEGKVALKALWTHDGDGSERLPSLVNLLARHVNRAEAMVASIEARATKGEWGAWSATEAQTGEDTSEPPATPPAAPQPPIPPTSEGAEDSRTHVDGCYLADDHPGSCVLEPDTEATAPPACELCGSTRAKIVIVDGTLRCANASDCEGRAGVAQARMAMDG